MTYKDLLLALQETALQDPSIKFTGAGNIYELNNLPNIDYKVFYITPNQSSSYEETKEFSLNLFYIDIWNNKVNNQIDIQSTGLETLTDIINRFNYNYPEVEIRYPYQFQMFYQKFSDVCAGCWVTVTFVVKSEACLIGNQYD